MGSFFPGSARSCRLALCPSQSSCWDCSWSGEDSSMRICSQIGSALRETASRAGGPLLSLFYPPHCAHCKGETPAGVHLCDQCAAEAPRVTEPYCEQCSQPFSGAMTRSFTCSNCEDRKFHFECAVA